MLTRAEVDPDRIGCCGQSGGATLTQFLAALDSRIRVAVVSEGNTENLAQADVEPPGSADDAEQNIVPGLARGIDRADLLYAFAPKPLLVTVTLHDAGHTYSPEYVTGSMDLIDEYKRVYGLLGAGDRVSLQATTVSHGYVYEMRRATVRMVQPLVGDERRGRHRDVAGRGVGRDAVRDADRFRDDIVRRRNRTLADKTARRDGPDAVVAPGR